MIKRMLSSTTMPTNANKSLADLPTKSGFGLPSFLVTFSTNVSNTDISVIS